MLLGCKVEFIEQYYYCLLEARVKWLMAYTELEYEVNDPLVYKVFYFDRKIELYKKLIAICSAKDRQVCKVNQFKIEDNTISRVINMSCFSGAVTAGMSFIRLLSSMSAVTQK
uniref:Uncharacterized protein n=1 Tax=Caenorhabditis japonica TaxID=281687 RepID=A0A8R1EN02_CAEJA